MEIQTEVRRVKNRRFCQVFLLLALLPSLAFSQSFSINANIINLSGQGQTVPATIVGSKLQFTNDSLLRFDSLIATNITGYLPGFDYDIPSTWLKHTKLPAQNIQPYLTGSVGVIRIADGQHVGALLGGGANYKPNGGKFGMAFEARWAKLPGFNNSTVIVSLGPNVSF